MQTQQAQAEATYVRFLPKLQNWVGWFALVRGDRLGGVFPTYTAATAAWMAMYGPVPALIRRIEPIASAAGTAVAPPPGRTGRTEPTASEPRRSFSVACNWAVPTGRNRSQQDYAA